MLARHLQNKLEQAVSQYPVVSVTGPRQSGKTTLIKAILRDHDYLTLEDPDVRSDALTDPRGFLRQFKTRVIIDEAQLVPDLFSYIQGIVDQADVSGQFVLSGSQNFLLLEKVSQSLAGRCAILHLLPFSYPELTEKKTMDLAHPGRSGTHPPKQVDLWDMLYKGFYPRIHDKQLEPQDWLANYVQSYVERDVRQVVNVGDVEVFNRFVRLCAGRNGQLLNMNSLAADCGVSSVTVKRWISILETSFIVKLLRPHYENFNKRMIKSPKLYFLDTGLLCYLLRIRDAQDLQMHVQRGSIFEAWVVSELFKHYCHQGVTADMYFWRDSTGNEIDLLIDQGQQRIPIEIKSGQTVNDEFFKNLHYYRKLANQPDLPALLIYGGERSAVRQGIKVLPWYNWR